MTQAAIHASLFRGGTSKGVYFEESDLPADRSAWDDLLLDLYGSPDPMQLDGIGGAKSTTSKAMVVSPGDGEADVSYRFGQVGITKPVVDWGGNCGNLTFAIGPFALERGVVPDGEVVDGRRELVLENENTGTIVEQSVPVEDGSVPRYHGEFKVYGVPGTGARIRSRFLEPGGSETGEVFPTGNRIDELEVPGLGPVEMSLVDVASPCVFVRAEAVGLTATETPDEIDADPELLDRLERIRSVACERYGFVDDAADATDRSPGIPKLAVVGDHTGYEAVDGRRVEADEFDLLARIMSMQKAHHAYAVTGAMCTAVATMVPGTIPNQYAALDPGRSETVTIGHPKGPMSIDVEMASETEPASTSVHRTARQIMDGSLYHLEK
jgi:2-methylaconitate cis-trans-isomerase PrpF